MLFVIYWTNGFFFFFYSQGVLTVSCYNLLASSVDITGGPVHKRYDLLYHKEVAEMKTGLKSKGQLIIVVGCKLPLTEKPLWGRV